jgi:hypothetical protein
VHTAQVEAQLHDGGSLRATFRMADKQEACDAADEFVRLNEPLIANAAISVTDQMNGRFDNAMLEDVADTIHDRTGADIDAIDAALREVGERELWDQVLGPAIDRCQDMAGIAWDV